MAKCEQCGFPHAIPGYCSNCGSNDPLPGLRLLRLAAVIFALVILAALAGIPVSLYLKHRAIVRDYPAAPPIPAATP